MAAAVGPLGASLYQGVEKSSFGFKLLENLGWKEGDGLGAKKQGIKEHVKVKKKHDALGVGAAEQVHRSRDWTTGMMSYDMILSGLKEISNKRAADAKDSDDSSSGDGSDDSGSESGYASDSESSGDERSAPPKAKRHKPAPAAAKSSTPKQAASSSSSSDSSDSDGSSSESEDSDSSSNDSSSISDSEANAAANARARTAKLATHVGRYRRREAAKQVKGYSATDLAAILGASADEVVLPARGAQDTGNGPSSGYDSGSSSSSSGGEDGESEPGSEERLRPATPTLEAPHSGSCERVGQLQPGAAGAAAGKDEAQGGRKWWGSMFVSAGRMGSKGSALRPETDAKAKVTVNGFSEQDQTNLYMQAHDGKTQNRMGLGRSDMPKKVGGVRWAGTKTQLGDSSDDGESDKDEHACQQRQAEEEAEAERRAAADEAAAGIVIVMPKSTKAAAPAANDTAVAAPAPSRGAKAEASGSKKRKAEMEGAEQQTSKKGKKQRRAEQEQQPQAIRHVDPVPAGSKRKHKAGTTASVAAATGKEKAAGVGPTAARKQKGTAAPAAADTAAPAATPPAPAADPARAAAAGKDVKWRKVALRILAAAPKRRMRARKLLKLALEAAGVSEGGDGQLEHMLGALRRSASKFDVSEKFVGLVAVAGG